MIEHKNGEYFSFNSDYLEVIKSYKDSHFLNCQECYFNNDVDECVKYACCESERCDKENIIFKIVPLNIIRKMKLKQIENNI